MASDLPRAPVAIRPYLEDDRDFLASVSQRLNPGLTISPRDPDVMRSFFSRLASGRLLNEPGAEAFVATINGTPAGLIAVHPDADYFTRHPRAYVDVLVVAKEAEGLGVGRALLAHVETWARDRGCLEVVLDVFMSNAGAMAFYEHVGYQPDHIRLAKPLI